MFFAADLRTQSSYDAAKTDQLLYKRTIFDIKLQARKEDSEHKAYMKMRRIFNNVVQIVSKMGWIVIKMGRLMPRRGLLNITKDPKL